MAQIHKLEVELEVNCSADKFYGMFTHNVTQLPNYLPQIFGSVEIIEGDGAGLSSVRVWKYALVDGKFSTATDRATFDNKRRSVIMTVLEGEVLNYYNSYETKLVVTPKGDGMSLVKWTAEYEKANEDVPSPTANINMMERVTKELSSLLLKA